MELLEYLDTSVKTLNYDFNVDSQELQVLIHGKDGIVTEVGELLEALRNYRDSQIDRANLVEELGDIFWYVAIFMRKYPILIVRFNSMLKSRMDYNNIVSEAIEMSVQASHLTDQFKRLIFYGKPPKNYSGNKVTLLECYEDNIIGRVSKLLQHWLNVCNYLRVYPAEVLGTNISKLQDKNKGRYRAGVFNTEEAFNRDLESEKEILNKHKENGESETNKGDSI